MFGQRSDCKVKTTPFAICGLAKKWHYKTNVTCRLFLHTHHPHQDLNLDIFVAQSSSYLRTNANISHSSTNMAVTDPTLKPRSNYHSSHTVVLLVGKEQQEMLVHTNIISAHSTFFRTALKKEWKEGQARVIKLPEDDPDIVTRYLDFVYHNRLVTQCKSQPDANYIDLALLYVYGERVLDTYIQNTIVEHLLKLTAVIDRNKAGHPHYPGPAVVEGRNHCSFALPQTIDRHVRAPWLGGMAFSRRPSPGVLLGCCARPHGSGHGQGWRSGKAWSCDADG
jgi:hypothetical protein